MVGHDVMSNNLMLHVVALKRTGSRLMIENNLGFLISTAYHIGLHYKEAQVVLSLFEF